MIKKITSVPFQIQKIQGGLNLIGWGVRQREDFFKQFSDKCKEGGIYQLTLNEVTASSLQMNYMRFCLNNVADTLGFNDDSLFYSIEGKILDMALNVQDDYIQKEVWVADIVDVQTGEIKGQKIVSSTKWTANMMEIFIDMIEYVGKAMIAETYELPNSKLYKGERKGRKNTIPFPECVSTIMFKF